MIAPERLREVDLYAWVGEDDLLPHGAEIGLKQGLVPAGYIPLVATSEAKINRGTIIAAMGVQATVCGKKIYLCRFRFDSVVFATAAGAPL